jgi:hypothetical protein
MTRKPSEFFVEFDATRNPDTDALDIRREDAETADDARKLARDISRREHVTVSIYRRYGIEDVTPNEDKRYGSLIWDWAEEFIGDTWEGGEA